MHLVRTAALRAGDTLSAITARLAAAFGVDSRLLPMSDQPVRTSVTTTEGRRTFQEYFVRDRAQGDVVRVDYDGAPAAHPAPGVRDAILGADLVVVCPSNPGHLGRADPGRDRHRRGAGVHVGAAWSASVRSSGARR